MNRTSKDESEIEHQMNPINRKDIQDIESRFSNRINENEEKNNNKLIFNPSKFLTIKNAIWFIDVSSSLVENIMSLYFLLRSSYPGYAIFIIFILIDLYKGYVSNILYLVMFYTYSTARLAIYKTYGIFFSICLECIQSYIYIQLTLTIPTSIGGLGVQLYRLPWYTESTIAFLVILTIQIVCILFDYFWNFKDELVLSKKRIEKRREKERMKGQSEEDISCGLCWCLCCCYGPIYMSCFGKGFYILLAQGYFTLYQTAFSEFWYMVVCAIMLWVVNDLLGSVVGDSIGGCFEILNEYSSKESSESRLGKENPESSNQLELSKTGTITNMEPQVSSESDNKESTKSGIIIKVEPPILHNETPSVPSESDSKETYTNIIIVLSSLLFAIFSIITFIYACYYLSHSSRLTSLQCAATVLCTLHFFPLCFPLSDIHGSLALLPVILFLVMLILSCQNT